MLITSRHAVLSARLHQLARRYVALHEQFANALGQGEPDLYPAEDQSGPPAINTTIGAQLAAFDRLQSRLRRLEEEDRQVQAAIVLRQQQGERLEQELAAGKQALERLHQLLEIRQTWLLQQQRAEWLRTSIVRRLRQQLAALKAAARVDDDEIKLLRRTRSLLAGCANVMRGEGTGALRETLSTIHSLVERVEDDERELQRLPRRAGRQNHAALGDQSPPEDRVRAILAEAQQRVARAKERLAQSELAAWSADAELDALGELIAWQRGELAGQQQWQAIERELAGHSRRKEEKLRQDHERAADALFDAEAELAGRQAQLSWLHGEIAARQIFARYAGRTEPS